VTKLGTIGYSISPSSAEAAAGAAISAEAAGLKAPYVNTSFPLGSTNVTPIALAMKTAGVDGVTASIETNSSFALITALRQEGVNLKVALLPTGYGGDLTGGGPGSEQAAQGVYFSTGFEPVEMQTAATQRFVNSLKTHAGVETDPTLGEYLGYMSVNAFVTGLNAAGSDPTQATFIKAMLGITNYNGTGLYGSHSVGFTMSQRGLAAGADNCLWITRYSGSSFHLIAGMDPICGTVFPGKTVSS
jgi:branched-chain amino acid transport system substrate-binding protein